MLVIFVISQSAGASVDQFLCHQRETALATGQNSGDHCSHFMTELFHFGTPVRGPWMIKYIKWEDYSQMIEDQIPVRLAIVKWWKNDKNVCPFDKTMPFLLSQGLKGESKTMALMLQSCEINGTRNIFQSLCGISKTFFAAIVHVFQSLSFCHWFLL